MGRGELVLLPAAIIGPGRESGALVRYSYGAQVGRSGRVRCRLSIPKRLTHVDASKFKLIINNGSSLTPAHN